MKKILFLVILPLMSTFGVYAQQGSKSAVAKVGYQSDYKRFGIGVEGRYEIIDNLRLAPELTFFIPNNKTIGLDVNVNAQYLFRNVLDNLTVYPLAGLNMSNNHYSGEKYHDIYGKEYNTSSSFTNFGFNLGAGAEYQLDKGFLVFDIKVVFTDGNYGQFNIGYGINF